MSEVCSDIVDCPHTTPHFTRDGIPVIRTTAVRDGSFVKEEITYTSKEEYEERVSRLVPQSGDIVFTREAPVGEAFVIPNGMRLSLGQRTMLLRPQSKVLNAFYFVCLLYEPSFRRKLMVLAGGSTNPHLNVAEVRDLSIPLPPIEEQHTIAECVSTLDARLLAGQANLAQLELVKSALSQSLLTGHTNTKKGEPQHAS